MISSLKFNILLEDTGSKTLDPRTIIYSQIGPKNLVREHRTLLIKSVADISQDKSADTKSTKSSVKQGRRRKRDAQRPPVNFPQDRFPTLDVRLLQTVTKEVII